MVEKVGVVHLGKLPWQLLQLVELELELVLMQVVLHFVDLPVEKIAGHLNFLKTPLSTPIM